MKEQPYRDFSTLRSTENMECPITLTDQQDRDGNVINTGTPARIGPGIKPQQGPEHLRRLPFLYFSCIKLCMCLRN